LWYEARLIQISWWSLFVTIVIISGFFHDITPNFGEDFVSKSTEKTIVMIIRCFYLIFLFESVLSSSQDQMSQGIPDPLRLTCSYYSKLSFSSLWAVPNVRKYVKTKTFLSWLSENNVNSQHQQICEKRSNYR